MDGNPSDLFRQMLVLGVDYTHFVVVEDLGLGSLEVEASYRIVKLFRFINKQFPSIDISIGIINHHTFFSLLHYFSHPLHVTKMESQQSNLLPPPNVQPFTTPERLLLGPGPSNSPTSVLQVMATPLMGHMDSQFLHIAEEVKALLRYVWQTENELTIPMSGTGSAAMETCVANLIQPGDKVLILINGYFGNRFKDMCERH